MKHRTAPQRPGFDHAIKSVKSMIIWSGLTLRFLWLFPLLTHLRSICIIFDEYLR